MSCAPGSQRHLVSSDLVREDLLQGGHSAVWGSFYSREEQRWGYACCRGLERQVRCRAEAKAEAEAEGPGRRRRARRRAEDSSDSEPRRAREQRVDWSDAPTELAPAGRGAAALVEHAVRFAVGLWARELEGLQGGAGPEAPELQPFRSEDALRQAREALGPLLLQLRGGAVDGEVLARLGEMVRLAAGREYAAANRVYMELTVGNKRWQNVVAGAQGLHNKGASIKLIPQSKLNAFDSDPAAQRYILALRRIVQFLQYKMPNADVSKHM